MSRFKGVYISGIPGAGCTLMRRLFLAFDGVIAPEAEMTPCIMRDRLAETDKFLASSRLNGGVFTMGVEEENLQDQLRVLRENDIGILVMLREFTETSRVPGKVWVKAYSEAFRCWDSIQYMLPYQRLIAEPDVVQKEVAGVFGLEAKHLFSDYPDFIDESTIPADGMPGHSLRRIGASYSKRCGTKELISWDVQRRAWKEQREVSKIGC
jgi:hypothetical protein